MIKFVSATCCHP